MIRFFLTAIVTFFTACFGAEIYAEQTESWLFTAPRTPTVPNVATDAEVSHPIDAFILSKLQPLEIQSATEASRQTLIRRLYFDLIGVPYQIIVGSKTTGEKFEFKEVNGKNSTLSLEEIKNKLLNKRNLN